MFLAAFGYEGSCEDYFYSTIEFESGRTESSTVSAAFHDVTACCELIYLHHVAAGLQVLHSVRTPASVVICDGKFTGIFKKGWFLTRVSEISPVFGFYCNRCITAEDDCDV